MATIKMINATAAVGYQRILARRIQRLFPGFVDFGEGSFVIEEEDLSYPIRLISTNNNPDL
jgi:hypothetical protein